jgi:MFS family permease
MMPLVTTDSRAERPEDLVDDGGVALVAAPVEGLAPPPELDVAQDAATETAAPGGLKIAGRRLHTFDSLIEVPAFRWYVLSSIGNWSALHMQQVVRGFLAFEITGSFAALGIVELGNTVPRMFLALYGGVVADRASRRVILQVSQVINAVLQAGMAVLLFTGRLGIEHLVIVSFAQGVMNSFALPARQSMIPEIVGRDRLMNAFALNVFNLNVLRLGAPALAGAMIAAIGAGWVFVTMSGLYIWASLAMFPIPATTARTRAVAAGGSGTASSGQRDRSGLRDIFDGIRYVRASHVLLALLVLQLVGAMLALPYQRLLPGFVSVVLADGDDDRTAVLMGLLLTFTAVGSLVGSLLIASLPSRRRGKLLIGSLVIFGLALFAFAASEVLWLTAGIAVIVGLGQSGRMSLLNVLVQDNTRDEYRGRVSAVLMLDDGLESLGVLGIALMADVFGPQIALTGVGFGLLTLAAVLWVTRIIRDLD